VTRLNHSRQQMKKPTGSEIGLGLLCLFAVLLYFLLDLPTASTIVKLVDNMIYDKIVQLDNKLPPQEVKTVIVDIDELSIRNEGRWPWPRDKMTALINQLKKAQVATIGLDLIMPDEALADARGLKNELIHLTESGISGEKLLKTLSAIKGALDRDVSFAKTLMPANVVLGFLFSQDRAVTRGELPKPLINDKGEVLTKGSLPLHSFDGYQGCLPMFLHANDAAGFVTHIPDSDGSLRRTPLIASFDDKIYPSLALAVAMRYLHVDHVNMLGTKSSLTGLQLGKITIPTNMKGEILIPYWDNPRTLSYYSATKILNNQVDTKLLQGSIVLIASTTTTASDLHLSPIAPIFPGVEMIGNLIQAIVGQQVAIQYHWHSIHGLLTLLLLGGFVAILFPSIGLKKMLLFSLLTTLLLPVASLALFVKANYFIPVSAPITLILLETATFYIYFFLRETREKHKISHLFSQYVPKEYVNELISYPENYSMEGKTRVMTVQFSDIRNFTGISEELDAVGVKHLLNTFFTPVTEIILSNRGTIDKYVGDSLVAFWGAPMEDSEHTHHALMSALSIFQRLPEINARLLAAQLPTVNIGIGIATGPMNVGDMGSEFRRAYTVLGDTVNLGSRLQDLTKFYQLDILTTDMTRVGQNQFLWRTVDKVLVRGRKGAVTLYQPLCLKQYAPSELVCELEDYHAALDCYYKCQWQEAYNAFDKLRHQYPHLHLYTLYLERIANFLAFPPPESWDGVYQHTYK
jgi:adenylate cyclase